MSTNNDALLPCPFCGKEPPDDLVDTLYPSGTYWREHKGGYRSYHSHKERQPGDKQCWQIVCAEIYGGCCAEMHADSREEVIQKWNCRTLAASKPELSNDKLREALAIADALRDGINSSHDWTGETTRAESFLRELSASKPEPQAQAAEPEVVAAMNCAGDGSGYVHVKFTPAAKKLPRGKYQCITLQAHREAMAKERLSTSFWREKFIELDLDLAKKDAALKACVEALEEYKKAGLGNSTNFEIQLCAARLGTAAIKQAQEAQR